MPINAYIREEEDSVECSACKSEIAVNEKFCGNCGNKAGIECQNCGKGNPAKNKFCSECGNKLSRDGASSSQQFLKEVPDQLARKVTREKANLEGERKQITVLFADLSDFTALSERLDPEEVRNIMDGCAKRIIQDVYHYEGTVDKFTGDGIIALFGAPIALEDHAVHSVRSAIKIQESVREYNNEVKGDNEIDLKMRIGINTGLVVVGSIGNDLSMDYTAMGDTINLASRLESSAEPGTILISESTYRSVKNKFDFAPSKKIHVKGKEAAVTAYKVLSSKADDTLVDHEFEGRLTTFVGRQREINTLNDRIDMGAKSHGQVISILGEAGLGKTRLIRELRELIKYRDIRWVEGRSLSYGKSIPYFPIINLLKSFFSVDSMDTEQVIRGKVEKGVQEIDNDLEWTIPFLCSLLSIGPIDNSLVQLHEREIRRKSYEAVSSIFQRESRNRTLLLVVENLQWVDSASEELINHIVHNIARSRIIILISTRPGYIQLFSDKSYYTQIILNPLSDTDCKSMINQIVRSNEISEDLQNLILNKCEGNPLYLEEVVKDLMEQSAIQIANGVSSLSKIGRELAVPGTILSIIMSRIDRLDENLKYILQCASVIGREFSFPLLNGITGGGIALHEDLEKLKELELIYDKGPSPEPEYIFKHSLTQEATYNSLLLGRRKELHISIGKMLENMHKSRLEEYYETLAYHFYQGEDKEKSLQYMTLAGDKAFRLHSTREAMEFYQKAIELIMKQPETEENKLARANLTLKLTRVLRFFESPKNILDMLKSIEDIADSLEDYKLRSRILSLISLFTVLLGRNQDAAIAYSEKSLDIASTLDDEKISSLAYYSLSLAYYFTRRINETTEIYEKSYDITNNAGDYFEACHILLLHGATVWHGGDYRKAQQYIKKSRDFAEEKKAPTMAAHSYCAHGGYGIFYGNITENFMDDCEKAMQIFKELNDLYYYLIVSGCYWFGVYKSTGNKDAIKNLEEIIETKEENDMWIWQPMLYSYLAEAYSELGIEREALTCCEKAIDIANSAGNKLEEGRGRIALGKYYMQKKNPDIINAEEAFKESVQNFESIEAKSGLTMSYYYLGLICKQLERNRESKAYLSKTVPMAKKAGLWWYLQNAELLLADIKGN